MKSRIFSTVGSLPITFLIVLMMGLAGCGPDGPITLSPPILPPNEVEQYIGEYQQMFADDVSAKNIAIINLVSIGDDSGFVTSAYTYQVHIRGLLGDPNEFVVALWDGQAFIIDQGPVAVDDDSVSVRGRLYLVGDELYVKYEMSTKGEPRNYDERYTKL